MKDHVKNESCQQQIENPASVLEQYRIENLEMVSMMIQVANLGCII